MHGNILPAPAGQAAPTLHDRAAKIREAHAAVVSAFGSAVEHAIKCGAELTEAKKDAGHGQWLDFLRTCGVGERQAQRYMKLAALAAGKSDLAKSDLTIEGAIRLLAPPKTPPAPTGSAGAGRPLPTNKSVRSEEKFSKVGTDPTNSTKPTESTVPTEVGPKSRPAKHTDIIAAWLAAAAVDRTKAVDSIGLDAIWAAMPPDWLPLLKQRLAERRQPALTAARPDLSIPADLTIPEFMRRTAPVTGNAADQMKAAPAALEVRA